MSVLTRGCEPANDVPSGAVACAGRAGPARPKVAGTRARRLTSLAAAALAAAALIGCNDQHAPVAPVAKTARAITAPRGALLHGQAKTDPKTAPAPAAPVATAGLLAYFGGRIVSNIQVVEVVYGSGSYLPQVTSSTPPNMGSFYQGVLNSAYVDWLSEYNTTGLPSPTSNQVLGRGSFFGSFTITPSAANNGTTIDDTNIKAELTAQIQAGTLPAPTHDAAGNNNTYYAIFFPHGKTLTIQGSSSCSVFCAYHGTIANVPGFGEIYYGVHPDFQAGSGCEFGCGAAATAFGNYTQVASHELVETMTDPEVGLASTVGPPLAWYNTSQGEIGDICNDQNGHITGSDGVVYDVQTEYSNGAGACVVSRSPSLSVSPTTFEGGTSATGIANLLATSTGATTVSLTSSDPSIVTVPASVVIPAGSTSASFSITSAQTTTQTAVTVTATFPTTPPTVSAVTLTVLPSPTVSTLTLAPPSVQGGAPSTATVVLSGPAPAGGASVSLASTNTSVATVPATLVVPAGSTTGTFTVTTLVTTFTTTSSISASYHGTTRSATLTVTRVPALTSINVTPSVLEGGGTANGTVTISDPAPAGGATVTLASTNSTVAPVPASVVVAAGQVSITFPIVTTTVATSTGVTISATYPASVTLTSSLTVVPSPTPTGLALNPTSVPGGGTSAGTVTLSHPAPAGGVTVALASSDTTTATVPASLAIAQGSSTGTFTITSLTTTTNKIATISASLNGLVASATLTVTKVLPVGNAVYDPALKAPRCSAVGSFCDTGGLVDGRDTIFNGPEQNQPNTIGSSCADGTSGTYHSDESIDGLKVSTVDGSNLAPGKAVKIDTTVWVFSSSDSLDLYLTTDATAASPVWTLLTPTSLVSSASQTQQVLSFTTTLPSSGGMSWAVRANYRYVGSQSSCITGPYDDHDDVVFLVDVGGPPPNQAPVVNAGPDQTVTLPAAATLAGAVTDDGLPNPPGTFTVAWSKVSGPGTVTFANPAVAATSATFSTAGTYVLRLTANDGALSASDDVTVTVNPQIVNQPPAVNAGPDLTVTLPAGATLAGTASDDGLPNPPGSIAITWTKVSGPGTVTFANASVASTTATFSAAGSYVLRLTASDSALSASDDVAVTVNAPVNQAPVVNAGPDQTITLPSTASLSGTVTDDGLPNPPATVTTTWTKVSGPGTVTFANASARATTATFSAAGSYVLRLTASDSALSASDDVAITVNAPVNQAPVVNAGPDQTITLPSTASLSGTVTDDGLPNPPATVTTTWTKVSGPGTVTFANASARATTATFSAAGSYVLRLTASDSVLSASDDIAVTVNAATGNGPCASLCTNPTNISFSSNYQSGNLGTGAVCYQTTSPVHGGNCGNFVSPRTLKVNGTTETCNNSNWSSVPAARNGGYCIQVSAGNQSYAYFTLF